jgi:hypothetical protein
MYIIPISLSVRITTQNNRKKKKNEIGKKEREREQIKRK